MYDTIHLSNINESDVLVKSEELRPVSLTSETEIITRSSCNKFTEVQTSFYTKSTYNNSSY